VTLISVIVAIMIKKNIMRFFDLKAESFKKSVIAKIIRVIPVNQIIFVKIICFFVGLLTHVDLFVISFDLFVKQFFLSSFYGVQRRGLAAALAFNELFARTSAQ